MEKQVHVSFYASLFRTECKVLTLEEIIILIRRRRWKNEILAYRTALAEGRAEEARKLKGGLPGFTPSGVFKGGHKASAIETYSQVVGLDFDHVKDLPALILTFRALSSTLAMFVSPGGEGLKVFVRVDCPAERHGEAYPLVAAFFEKAGGVASDAKCKDISRCCYVGDDGEAYYNPDAEVFHIPEKQSAEKGVDAFVARFLDRIPPLAGARNQTVYRLGCEANRRGFSYTETAACCTLRLQAADFTATEIEQALHSAYQGNINEHATYGGAKGQIDREISPTVFKTGHPLETEEIETSGEGGPRSFPTRCTDGFPICSARRSPSIRSTASATWRSSEHARWQAPASPKCPANITANGCSPTFSPSRWLPRPTARGASTTCAIWPTCTKN